MENRFNGKRLLTVRSLGNYRARVNCLNRTDSCGNSGNFARGKRKKKKKMKKCPSLCVYKISRIERNATKGIISYKNFLPSKISKSQKISQLRSVNVQKIEPREKTNKRKGERGKRIDRQIDKELLYYDP